MSSKSSKSSKKRKGHKRSYSGPASVDRPLTPLEFAEARATELKTLTSVLNSSTGTRTSFQTLPRNLRRRSMSHNIRRMPVRLREQALAVTIPPADVSSRKSRKARRRHRVLKEEYGARAKKVNWLETHLWHAKRMKMETKWGWRMPVTPTEKSDRPCFRAASWLSTVHDASYKTAVEVVGPRDQLQHVLVSLVATDDAARVQAASFVSGSVQLRDVVLYEPGRYPFGALGPAALLFSPTHEEDGGGHIAQLWLWIHPAVLLSTELALRAAVEALSTTSDDVSVRVMYGELVRFELNGPKSTAVLRKVLRLHSLATGSVADTEMGDGSGGTDAEHAAHGNAGDNQQKVWDVLSTLASPASVRSGAVLALNVLDPRLQRHGTHLDRPLPYSQSEATAGENGLAGGPSPQCVPDYDDIEALQATPGYADACASVVANWPLDGSLSVSPIWSEGARVRVGTDVPTDAAVATAKSQGELEQGVDVDLSQTDEFSRAVPILLVQRPPLASRGLGSGWDVIIPRGWGMPFWRAIVYNNCRAVGTNELKALAVETGTPFFPDDFPDSGAGMAVQLAASTARQSAHAAKPKAKRPNYQVLGVPSPFGPAWLSLFEARVSSTEGGGAAIQLGSTSGGPASPAAVSDGAGKSGKNSGGEGGKRGSKGGKGGKGSGGSKRKRDDSGDDGAGDGRGESGTASLNDVPGGGVDGEDGGDGSGTDGGNKGSASGRSVKPRLEGVDRKGKGVSKSGESGGGGDDGYSGGGAVSSLPFFVLRCRPVSLFPSHLDEEELRFALGRVCVKMAGRGRPAELSMICLPSRTDCRAFANSTHTGSGGGCGGGGGGGGGDGGGEGGETGGQGKRGPWLGVQQPLGKNRKPRSNKKTKQGRKQKSTEKAANAPQPVQPSREIIGYVVAGGFSFVKGKGAGVGFCSLEGLRAGAVLGAELGVGAGNSRGDGGSIFVLVRTSTSRDYKPAFVSWLP